MPHRTDDHVHGHLDGCAGHDMRLAAIDAAGVAAGRRETCRLGLTRGSLARSCARRA